MKNLIETRIPAESGQRVDKGHEHPVYQAPQMFVIGSANHLMRGAHHTGGKDKKSGTYYHY